MHRRAHFLNSVIQDWLVRNGIRVHRRGNSELTLIRLLTAIPFNLLTNSVHGTKQTEALLKLQVTEDPLKIYVISAVGRKALRSRETPRVPYAKFKWKFNPSTDRNLRGEFI